MLTEKDYCDYDTCVALKELGYIGTQGECCYFGAYYQNGNDIFYDRLCNPELGEDEYLRVPLYLAQKWLREEKGILVYPEKDNIGWFYTTHYNIGEVHRFKYSEEYYDSYEEALSEGVRASIKILQDEQKENNQTIH